MHFRIVLFLASPTQPVLFLFHRVRYTVEFLLEADF